MSQTRVQNIRAFSNEAVQVSVVDLSSSSMCIEGEPVRTTFTVSEYSIPPNRKSAAAVALSDRRDFSSVGCADSSDRWVIGIDHAR